VFAICSYGQCSTPIEALTTEALQGANMEYEFEFEYEPDDYRKGLTVGLSESRAVKVRYLILILGVVFVVSVLTFARSAGFGGFCYSVNFLVAGAIGIVIWVVFGPQILARLQRPIQPKPGERQRWTLDENGVRIVTPHSTSETKWPGFSKLVEDQDFMLLYFLTNVAAILPKRAIPGDIREQVMLLIRSNIGTQNEK
jgi:hypothetical protein